MAQTKSLPKTLRASIKLHYRSILLITLVFAAILIVYGNDLSILANEAFNNEAYNYILLIPFFTAFLFYLKKDAVKATLMLNGQNTKTTIKYANEILGAALCIVAFLTYWYGSYTFYPLEYHIASLPIFIMGIVLILLNPKALLTLIFPILFLFFLVPLPTTLTYTLGGALANINTQASYSIMKAVGIPITLSTAYGAPTIMLTTAAGNPTNFSVDIPCSGLYSLLAFTMFASFLALISKTSNIKKILLFALGFLIFAILNIFRIVTVVSTGYWFGEQTALTVHSFAGLVLIFIGMLLLLGFSEKILKFRIITKTPAQTPCPECQTNLQNLKAFCQNCGIFFTKSRLTIPRSMFAKILLLLLGCSIAVLSIRAPTFATAQNSIELATNANTEYTTSTLPNMTGYNLVFLYRDTNFERIARQDLSIVYAYFPQNTTQQVIYVAIGVSNSLSNLHNWEACFVTWQTAQGQYPLVNVLDQRDTQLLPDTPLIARYFAFESPDDYTQTTLYWYEKATFKTGLTIEQKYVRISLIILTTTAESYEQHEQELLTAGQTIASAWEPMKTQALISLGIPAQQALLAASIVFLAATETTQYFNQK